MAHHAIKYRLTADGTIPNFVSTGPDAPNGLYPVDDPNTAWPRNLVLIGISNGDDVGDAEIVATQQDLVNYLTAVGQGWGEYSGNDPSSDEPPSYSSENFTPFDAVKSAADFWSALDRMNS